MKEIALVVSCEHAVNTVPKAYQPLFEPHLPLLQSHRGSDFGAQAIAMAFSENFCCDLIQAQTTRLLIDCNRSLHHRHCFSEITRLLANEEKTALIQQYYLPFRRQVEECIKRILHQKKFVLHLSIHSFIPILDDNPRNTDIGLLYDPKRANEKRLATLWQQQFKQRTIPLRVRLNYPYRGIADGFTTALRKIFADDEYAGIELESNQALTSSTASLSSLCNALVMTLRSVIRTEAPF